MQKRRGVGQATSRQARQVRAGSGAQALTGAAAKQWFQAAERHAREGRLAEAAALCEQILRQETADTAAQRLLGAIKAKLGDHPEAIRLLSAAAAALPNDPVLQNNLGA